jgi:hypothetical protein
MARSAALVLSSRLAQFIHCLHQHYPPLILPTGNALCLPAGEPGTLTFTGSLDGLGSLGEYGSLPWHGSLQDYGSLIFNGSLVDYGSLLNYG